MTRRILITLTDETMEQLRQKAFERFGKRKGGLSIYVEDALKTYWQIGQFGTWQGSGMGKRSEKKHPLK